MSVDSTRERWVGRVWVSLELWAEGGDALGWALRCAAPWEADAATVSLDGFSLLARDPEMGVQVLVTGCASRSRH